MFLPAKLCVCVLIADFNDFNIRVGQVVLIIIILAVAFPGPFVKVDGLIGHLPQHVYYYIITFIINKKESLEIFNLVLQLVVDVRLKKVLVLVVVLLHPHLSRFILVLSRF
jgi:hypothetical protein